MWIDWLVQSDADETSILLHKSSNMSLLGGFIELDIRCGAKNEPTDSKESTWDELLIFDFQLVIFCIKVAVKHHILITKVPSCPYRVLHWAICRCGVKTRPQITKKSLETNTANIWLLMPFPLIYNIIFIAMTRNYAFRLKRNNLN